MATDIDILSVIRILGKKVWATPRPFGPNGWQTIRQSDGASIIVSVAPFDGEQWIHASIAHQDHTPSYEDLVTLHRAVFGDRWAYQVFAPPASHVNIHPHALHLWGRLDGTNQLPDFGKNGTI